MFVLYRIVFAPAKIALLFTHKNSDFDVISVTERSCATPISKVEGHIACVAGAKRGGGAGGRKANRIPSIPLSFSIPSYLLALSMPATHAKSHMLDRCSYYTGYPVQSGPNHSLSLKQRLG